MRKYRKHKTMTMLFSICVLVAVSHKLPQVVLPFLYPEAGEITTLLVEIAFGTTMIFISMYFMFLRPLMHEIENRRALQQKLLEIERNNRAVVSAFPDNILRLSSSGSLIDFKTGHWDSLHTVNNIRLEDLLPAEIAAKLSENLLKTIATESVQVFEVQVPGDDNRFLHKECRMAKCDDDSVIVIIRDVTEQKTSESRLWYMSTHDTLTGLYNRNFFDAELDNISKGRDFPVSIIIMDIDKLKDTNDIFGHSAGDKLICDMAEILRKAFRADDIVARIGGDEFAVILPKSGSEDVKQAVERIYHCLENEKKQHQEITLDFSLGYATTDAQTGLVKTMKRADKMMYRNKYDKKQNVISLSKQIFGRGGSQTPQEADSRKHKV